MGAKPAPKLRIGEGYVWRIEKTGVRNPDSDQSSVAHRVEEMPLGLRAKLCPADRDRCWTYVVHREDVQIARGEECYESKEEALAGLQTWLQAWLARPEHPSE